MYRDEPAVVLGGDADRRHRARPHRDDHRGPRHRRQPPCDGRTDHRLHGGAADHPTDRDAVAGAVVADAARNSTRRSTASSSGFTAGLGFGIAEGIVNYSNVIANQGVQTASASWIYPMISLAVLVPLVHGSSSGAIAATLLATVARRERSLGVAVRHPRGACRCDRVLCRCADPRDARRRTARRAPVPGRSRPRAHRLHPSPRASRVARGGSRSRVSRSRLRALPPPCDGSRLCSVAAVRSALPRVARPEPRRRPLHCRLRRRRARRWRSSARDVGPTTRPAMRSA